VARAELGKTFAYCRNLLHLRLAFVHTNRTPEVRPGPVRRICFMGTTRKSSEGAVSKAAKLPPKRKVVAKPAAVEAAVKPKARKAPAKAEAPKSAILAAPIRPENVQLAPEVVALRAYFISEQRTAAGKPGDSMTDWLEAERQLLAEKNG
jgi:hypothetical protein